MAKPAAKPPVDLDSLSEEDRKAYLKYGSLPKRHNAAQQMMQKTGGAKKYFDSADWMQNQQGKGPAGPGANLPHRNVPVPRTRYAVQAQQTSPREGNKTWTDETEENAGDAEGTDAAAEEAAPQDQ